LSFDKRLNVVGDSTAMFSHGHVAMRRLLIGMAAYFILASSTILLTSNGRSHATVWPADAIILALLLGSSTRTWPSLLFAGYLANFLANVVTRGWSDGLVFYGIINMSQAWLAATLIRKMGAHENLLEDAKSTLRFIGFAGVLAPAMGAAAGSLVSLINFGESFGPSFFRWFASNSLGLLVVTPFAMALFDGNYLAEFKAKSFAERMVSLGLLAIHGATCALIFTETTLPLLFLPMSTLLALSFRCGRAGAMAGVVVVALFGGIAAFRGTGPIALTHDEALTQALVFQCYLAVILCTALPLTATVAARAQALVLLAQRDEAIRLIMDSSSNAVLGFDSSGTCRWAAGQLEDYLDLRPDQLRNLKLEDLAPHLNADLQAVLGSPPANLRDVKHVEFVPAGRPMLTLEASVGRWEQAGAWGFVVTIRDISMRKLREAAISRMAETDDLTGVLNRKGFKARINEAFTSGKRPLTLALIDVDHFKSVNDNFGHSVGDVFLQEVAVRLQAHSDSPQIVGRLGGDEFAILFEVGIAEARKACEAMVAAIGARPVVNERGIRLNASISCGIAELDPSMSRGQLFEAADSALYAVKRSGRNGVGEAGGLRAIS